MLIGLLIAAVPTILILAILILFMNSRSKRVMDELAALKTQLEQLEQLGNVSVPASPVIEMDPESAEDVIQVDDSNNVEAKDAEIEENTDVTASAYNTGKSGKTYTKEELELLIRE